MCGRYGFVPGDKFYDRFEIENRLERLEACYNVTPGYLMPTVVRQSPNKTILMKWGLIPHWAKDPKIGYQMINARSETLAQKPAFRQSLISKRCLIPASGFYEWKKADGRKIPYYIRLKKTDLFAFAGLYDTWIDASGGKIQSYTIITTVPNKLLVTIHDRMPVILQKTDENIWLNGGEKDIKKITGCLKTYPEEKMEAYPVSPKINSPSNDSVKLIKLQEPPEEQIRIMV